MELQRSFDDWNNHPSAVEWERELSKLVVEAKSKGFCSIYNSIEEAEAGIGSKPVLNKLGVIKEKNGKVKARITWDMKELKVLIAYVHRASESYFQSCKMLSRMPMT